MDMLERKRLNLDMNGLWLQWSEKESFRELVLQCSDSWEELIKWNLSLNNEIQKECEWFATMLYVSWQVLSVKVRIGGTKCSSSENFPWK